MATNEVIHNRTTVYFDWLDRLRILLGKAAHVEVDVEIAQPEVTVLGSNCRTWVERVIPRRHHGGYAITADHSTNP